jgi:histidyl-tRNA synthetase
LAVIVGPDEEAKQVFNLRNLATRQEDKGLAWSVLEDSVQSLLEIIKQERPGP